MHSLRTLFSYAGLTRQWNKDALISRQDLVCERPQTIDVRSGGGNQEIGNIGTEMLFESFVSIRQREL